jgi:pSer/pThr/pTyr-binding forkhead associated (FHA) protein
LGSSNGVLVNATKIDGPYRLSHCDRILIGSAAIYFMHPALDAPYQVPKSAQAPASATGDSAGSTAMVQCQICGTSNPAAAYFCVNCGAPLEQNAPAQS